MTLLNCVLGKTVSAGTSIVANVSFPLLGLVKLSALVHLRELGDQLNASEKLLLDCTRSWLMERFVVEIERTYGELRNHRMRRLVRKLNPLPKFKGLLLHRQVLFLKLLW